MSDNRHRAIPDIDLTAPRAVRGVERESPRLRIAMVSISFYETDPRVRRAAHALVERGHDVDLLCLKDGTQMARPPAGLRLIRLGLPRRRRGLLRYVYEYGVFSSWVFAQLTWRHLRRAYDVVYINNMPNFLVFTALAPRLSGARVVLDVHDPGLELIEATEGRRLPRPLRWLVEAEERASLSFCDAVITVNEPMRERLLAASKKHVSVAVVMNLPDPGLFAPRERSDSSSQRLVYSGVITPRHGVDVVVRAFALLSEEFPDLQLRIVGDGPSRPEVVALASSLGVSDRIDFVGNVPLTQIPSLIEDATVAISAHRDDAFGSLVFSTKAAEYMALGLPTVCSGTVTMRRYFRDEDLMFFESTDAKDLAEKVRTLLLDRSSAEAMSMRGQQRVHSLSWLDQKSTLVGTVEHLVN